MWGSHAGQAVLSNPNRTVFEVLATRNATRDLPPSSVDVSVVEPKEIDAVLPGGAAHQGLAVRCSPPTGIKLGTLAEQSSGIVVVLDQVTDPHNAGAIIRSAVAFGACGLVMQDRKAPPLFGACAKAAVGAAERIPHARVVNISRSLDTLREMGWRVIGLAGEGERSLADAAEQAAERCVLVLGAEGRGLRPSVAAACHELAHIPINDDVESLNVSTAAAIALYEVASAAKRAASRP